MAKCPIPFAATFIGSRQPAIEVRAPYPLRLLFHWEQTTCDDGCKPRQIPCFRTRAFSQKVQMGHAFCGYFYWEQTTRDDGCNPHRIPCFRTRAFSRGVRAPYPLRLLFIGNRQPIMAAANPRRIPCFQASNRPKNSFQTVCVQCPLGAGFWRISYSYARIVKSFSKKREAC